MSVEFWSERIVTCLRRWPPLLRRWQETKGGWWKNPSWSPHRKRLHLPLFHKNHPQIEQAKAKGQSQKASEWLPTVLISNDSRLTFQLSPSSTPTSIIELLSNHVFRSSPNLMDHRMVSTIFRVIESTEHSNSFTTQTEEDLFRASKRQVLLINSPTLSFAFWVF